jgi:chemotaxis-related protein WspB
LLNYHGAPVPVIDLCELMLGRPAAKRLSTRQILVHYPVARGARRLLGLLAERVTETLRCEAADFIPSGVGCVDAPYLGPVAAEARGLIQRIDAHTLLPPSLRDLLFEPDQGVGR